MRKIIIIIIFITGLSIFIYPVISNWLSEKDHYTAISKHNEALAELTLSQKEKEAEKARAFNASLTEMSVPIEDPFTSSAGEAENASYYSALDIGESIGSLEIPSLQVNLPIYHGASEDVLQKGIGHMSNSSLPIGGERTHAALTGHRGLPSSTLFRNLDKLVEGDMFYVNVLGEALAYKVDQIEVVLPTETSWLEMVEDKDYVTLITCEPYMINTHRLLVRGERVEVAEENSLGTAKQSESSQAIPKIHKKKSYFIYLTGLLLVLAGLLYYWRKKQQVSKDE